jgi:hypothetical protein
VPRLSALSLRESEQLFSAATRHVSLPMKRISGARVLWVNRRAMHLDPQFQSCGGSIQQYRERLLHCCGYAIADEVGDEHSSQGLADRYGGWGIGNNGGSGRSVVINGYYVKGVGRTPLIGVGTESEHMSGGAYLEECVRESILSELVDAEFPYGAVPTLAIIDTGATQVWHQFIPAKVERRCLLVRPCFLRPAHLERASNHISEDERQGHIDAERVQESVTSFIRMFGHDALLSTYRKFWLAWAEQLAYSFVHRLPHGGENTSNIALDGRLVDFGATAAVPSWARVVLEFGGVAIGETLTYVAEGIKTHTRVLERYVCSRNDGSMNVPKTIELAARRYRDVVLREVLRVVGLSTSQAQRLLASEHRGAIAKLIGRMVGHFRREHMAVFAGTPPPRIPWDLDQFWSEVSPQHAKGLRDFLIGHFEVFARGERRSVELEIVAARCRLRSKSREELYREQIKRDLYRTLEVKPTAETLTQSGLDQVISEAISRNRRDSLVEPDGAIPIGFARGAEKAYALFRSITTGREVAVLEWDSYEKQAGRKENDVTLEIAGITFNALQFRDSAVPPFHGTVTVT